jgi:spore coat protein U-like protein
MSALVRRIHLTILLALPMDAALAAGCSLATDAQLSFGPIVALASTGDVDSNTGGSLTVRCSADVALPPRLYSSSSRQLSGPGGYLPFRLSLMSPGGPDLPEASPGAALAVPSDDTDHAVTLHGRVRASDFAALPGGSYTGTVTLTIEY